MPITLLEMLLEAGLITPAQCDEALQNRVFFGGRIGTNLIELGFLEEEDLARFLGKQLAVPYVDPAELLNLPPAVIGMVPRDLALHYQVVPLRLESRRLYVAMADPLALTAIDEIAFITGHVIKPLITPEVRLVQALGKYYGLEIDDRYRRIITQVEARQLDRPAAPRQEPAPGPAAGKKISPAAKAAPSAPPPKPAEVPASAEPEAPSPAAELAPSAAEPAEEAWQEKIERHSIDHLSRALAWAEDRKAIADILLRYLGQEFDRSALFLIKGDTASGWRGVHRGAEIKEFNLVRIPLTRPSVLKTVAEGKSYYLGAIADSPLNERMLAGLGGGRPETALLVPLSLGGRVVIILYAEGGKQELSSHLAELQKLAGKAVLAFEILIARDKILMG